MSTDPFADIPLSAEMRADAYTIRKIMQSWIDEQANTLKQQAGELAEEKARQLGNSAMAQMQQFSDESSKALENIRKKLVDLDSLAADAAKIKALKDELNAAVQKAKDAQEAQKQQVAMLGETLGKLAKTVILA